MWLENRDITDSDKFKRWFGDSIIRDENGPIPVYHGTQGKPFDKFDKNHTSTGRFDPEHSRGVISFTFTLEYGKRYAGANYQGREREGLIKNFPHSRVIEAYLRIRNPFDYRKPDHRKLLIDHLRKWFDNFARTKAHFLNPDHKIGQEQGVNQENREEKIKEYIEKEMSYRIELLENGEWSLLENYPFLKGNGFDGVYTFEKDRLHIHVLEPDQIWIVKQTGVKDFWDAEQ
jgi:hypothetical protein